MYTLLTGATGLVGRYLVRDLLLNGHNLAVVVRTSKKFGARERMEQILRHWEEELGRSLPRPVVLTGDISAEGFALSDEDRDWVANNVDTIIHSAAILEFYGEDRNGEPWRTNLGGTRNMINLCRELKIHDIHYVSTAYVAGTQTTTAMEDALDVGQGFRNDYEESKFLAEKEVRAIDFADHVTVYRPAVISGDSITGYTNTYHGIYLYLRLMALMIPAQPVAEDGTRHTPIRLSMTGEETRNIIPVEWISAVTVRLFETQEARGGTYHMAPDNPMTSGDMIRWSGEYFNSTGVEFCGHDFVPEETDRDENEDQWMFERLAKENMGTYEPYERTDNVFDMTNLKKFAGDIVCPEIDRTVIHRYLDYGEQDKWGKRRPKPLTNESWADEVLGETNGASLPAGDHSTVGVDVLGPGGGQFSVSYSSDGIVGVTRGLPNDNVPLLRLTLEDLAKIREQPEDVAEQFVSMLDQVPADSADSVAAELLEVLSKDGQLTSAG
ncbi:SDR family oxidoreductase [Fuerstiella marisgermanici]|uniref:Linear gramicidin synthase subunit D n=1 Tax=Fuerstiella marisgermanici TaxID=1891926 RepID=A0A1P8WGC8_9PLAN|nr:SDR family oxidoreductase [Fuerstiella marisgermanici]APZ93105.1 Linear gramicidin synthase subunit D [Fuerstiella marisgermanici]